MFFMSKSSQRIPSDGGPPNAKTPANAAASHTKLGVEMRTVEECGTSFAIQKLLPPLVLKGNVGSQKRRKRLAREGIGFPCPPRRDKDGHDGRFANFCQESANARDSLRSSARRTQMRGMD